MPSASGLECVRVLIGFGWIAAHWTAEECLLENGRFVLRVPVDGILASERVAEIATLAGVARLAFVAGLERIRAQEATALAVGIANPRRTS